MWIHLSQEKVEEVKGRQMSRAGNILGGQKAAK